MDESMEAIDVPAENNDIVAPSEVNQVFLDSLPYIDQIHPDYEAYALTLIEEEMQKLQPPSQISYDANSTAAFKSSKHAINKTEYESLVKRNGKSRDKTEETKFTKCTVPENLSDKLQWEKSIRQAKIELEYERLRQVNAELQSEYSSSLWKYHANEMESNSKFIKSCLEDQLMKVDTINARRKDMQEVQAAPKLVALNQRWAELIHKNRHLARGVGDAEDELVRLQKTTGVLPHSEESAVA